MNPGAIPPPVVVDSDFRYTRFLKGALHVHSTRSDGRQPIEDALAAHVTAGFDFAATTDHDFASYNDEFSRGAFASLAGEEVSPSFRKPDGVAVYPHIGAICGNGVTLGLTPEGLSLWTEPPLAIEDPRLVEDVLVDSLVDTIRQVREVGEGLAILNHPNFRRGLNSSILLRVSERAPFSLLEIANQNDAVLTQPDATHEGDEEIWDVLLTAGHRVFGLATDDSHYVGAINQGYVQVVSPTRSSTDLCKAIALGRFYATTGVVLSAIDYRGSVLSLEIAADSTEAGNYQTQFIGTGGALLDVQTGLAPHLEVDDYDVNYVRAKVTNTSTQAAWVQPIFLTGPD